MKQDVTSSSKASLLSRWKNRSNKSAIKSEISKIPNGVAIPLSREQKRLWFLQQLNPNNSFYNYSELYRLEGKVDVALFEKSIRIIEEKHDILRSTYHVRNGVPAVEVSESSQSKFIYHDLSNQTSEVASKKTDEFIKKYASHTFRLSDETLLRSTIIKVAQESYLYLIVMHHIITDKWSMKVFRKELAYYYECLIQGKQPVIEKLEIQYANYAYWQGNQPLNDEHLTYWKDKLAGDIPTLNLSTDHPKKAQPSYKGTFDKNYYDRDTSNAFFTLCKKMDATPYITMLSVYYILLQKYSGQQDILIGTPITKREQTSLENLIGFFNDTLVLRTTVRNSFSFKELVQEVKKTTLDAFSNKDISFDTLVKTLKPERSLSVHPFFQVMFLYHKVPETPSLGSDIKISYEPYDAGVAKFDLTLYISEDQGSLMSLMEYETDLFEATTIARMHAHFELILKTVIQNPEQILFTLSIETQEEAIFYKTQELPIRSYNIPHQGIHELIIAQAQEKPDAIALNFENQRVTYKDLDKRSTQIANYLLTVGIKKNDIVGLCIDRSTEMIIALVGILKAGAAYLPLDPEYPAERISYILDNAFAKALLTQQKLATNFNNLKAPILTLEAAEIAEIKTECALPAIEKADLAYVIYTSGSTGKPKGVPISHGNIMNSTLARTDFYGSDPSVFLLMSSISFDSSKTGIFWSLCTGATLVISEKHLEQDINRLEHTIKSHNVSHTLMLPSLYAQLIQYGDAPALKSLGTVIVAGEACSPQLVRSHFEIAPDIHLYNEYGPTESTVWCIAHKIQQKDAFRSIVPIGKPIKNLHAYILNDSLQKVPYGVAGELYIGGLGLASGYLNDTEKTKNAFVQNPFDNDGSERLYKTGDLARYTADGTIEFLGRKDQQVKVRGYRIELDEIEQLLHAHQEVSQAVVTVKNDIDTINWEELEDVNMENLLQLVSNHITENEANEILNSIESLPEEALGVVLKNLD